MSDYNLQLKLENLEKLRNSSDPIGFINWLKKNLDLYDDDDDETVPVEHIKVYLKYILNEVRSPNAKIDHRNKANWIRKIKRLQKGAEVIGK